MLSRTQTEKIFEALAAPFYDDEVKFVPAGGGMKAPFVTARHCMNRLDDVLGFGNWYDTYIPTEHGCICALTIRLPDGTEVTKSDAGGNAGMSDTGDDEKSAFSSAFKRACVKFGIGRYLYGNGVPVRHRHLFKLKDDGGVWAPQQGYPYNVRPLEDVTPEDPYERVEKWLLELVEGYNDAWATEAAKRKIDGGKLFNLESLAFRVATKAYDLKLVNAAPVQDDVSQMISLLLDGLRADEAKMEKIAAKVYSEVWNAALAALTPA